MVDFPTVDDRPDLEPIRRILGAALVAISRHWKAGLLTFAAALLGVALAISITPRHYTSQMKLLVKRERLDPVLSPQSVSAQQSRMEVTDTELNSEAELLHSRDLLESVVLASGLIESKTPGLPAAAEGIALTVKALDRDLSVKILKRTTLIEVQYTSTDPRLAARVLSNLARLYLDKHLAVNRPSGAYEFFTTQVDDYRAKLRSAEERLKDFGAREHVVSATAEGVATLQRLADFEADLQQAEAAVIETTRRLDEIQLQLRSLPPRVTTSIRTSQNAEYVRDLRANVLALELKLADLSGKFAPTYPPLVVLQKQLDQTKGALASAEHTPITDETTDRDPTYQWLDSEAARVRVEHEASVARAASLKRSIAIYRARAAELDAKDVAQQRLSRDVKSAEDNFLLYQQKQEETRIADALDHRRFANVVVAEAPNVPSLPSDDRRRTALILLGTTISFLLGLGAAVALEFIPARVRSVQQLRATLNLPEVVAVSTSGRQS
jgi:uncharacterized protein involved in exopolysaccharide biosynthesis